jgi:diacylglycerol kinase (ATP)
MKSSPAADRPAPQIDPRGGPRSLAKKFQTALRGLGRGVRRESNFRIHLSAAALVILLGYVLQVSTVEWCLLVLSIFLVLAAEIFNTALEMLARAITRDFDEDVKDALDTSSAGVLLVAWGAAIVGGVIFCGRLAVLLGWW